MKRIKIIIFTIILISIFTIISFADGIWMSNNNCYLVEKDGKYGIVDKNDNIIIPFEYDFIYDNLGDMYIVSTGNRNTGKKYGAIDLNGNMIFDLQYDYLVESVMDEIGSYEYNNERLLVAKKDDKYGIINTNGKTIIPFEYDYIRLCGYNEYPYVDNQGILIQVFKDGKDGAINFNNEVVIPIEYDSLKIYKEGPFRFEKDGKYGYVDRNGNILSDDFGKQIYEFNEGFAVFEKDGKWGFINSKMEIAIEPIYDHVGQFYNGIAPVEVNGKYGGVDRQGQLIIPIEYDTSSGVRQQYKYLQDSGKVKKEDIQKELTFSAYQELTNDMVNSDGTINQNYYFVEEMEKDNTVKYIFIAIISICIILTIFRTVILYKKDANYNKEMLLIVGILLSVILLIADVILIINCLK